MLTWCAQSTNSPPAGLAASRPGTPSCPGSACGRCSRSSRRPLTNAGVPASLEAAAVAADQGSGQALALIQAIEGSDDLNAALGVWVSEQLKLAESFDSVMPAPLVGGLTGDASVDKPGSIWAASTPRPDRRCRSRSPRPDAGARVGAVVADDLGHPVQGTGRRFHDGPWSGGSWHWLERVGGFPRPCTADTNAGAAWLTTSWFPAMRMSTYCWASGSLRFRKADVLAALIEVAAQPADGVPGTPADRAGGARLVAPGVKIGQTTAPRPDPEAVAAVVHC